MIADFTSLCTWPSLPEPFASALRLAVEFIFRELDPVGIVATGTIIRGTAHANSDLDLYVIHVAPHRRRIQRFFNGVPTEIFVNPPAAVRVYFGEEDRDGRRLTAHMLATGVVIFRAGAVVDELRAEAAEWLAKETRLSDFERTSTRHTIASRLEDALDVLGADDVTATMLLGDAVLAMLEYLCKAEHGQIPRRKDLLAQLTAEHPDVADRAVEFFRASLVSDRARLAMEIADRTIDARRFFEWDSGAGPAPS
jgi:predicted nucleotidyltransferase